MIQFSVVSTHDDTAFYTSSYSMYNNKQTREKKPYIVLHSNKNVFLAYFYVVCVCCFFVHAFNSKNAEWEKKTSRSNGRRDCTVKSEIEREVDRDKETERDKWRSKRLFCLNKMDIRHPCKEFENVQLNIRLFRFCFAQVERVQKIFGFFFHFDWIIQYKILYYGVYLWIYDIAHMAKRPLPNLCVCAVVVGLFVCAFGSYVLIVQCQHLRTVRIRWAMEHNIDTNIQQKSLTIIAIK